MVSASSTATAGAPQGCVVEDELNVADVVARLLQSGANEPGNDNSQTKKVSVNLIDFVPVVSQIKSAFMASTGDQAGALKVQEAFVVGCPVISQVTSLVQWVAGNSKAARETQQHQVAVFEKAAAVTPGVGHVLGVCYQISGDWEKARKTYNMAFKSSATVAAGVGAAFAAPVVAPAAAAVGISAAAVAGTAAAASWLT
eukprot:Partr_v1_DN41645_c0_g1_i1_m5682 putative NA